MTYASRAIAETVSAVPLEDAVDAPLLHRLYALLVLVRGSEVTAQDVHDAWSIWRETTGGDLAHVVPYGSLPPEVQAKDDHYVRLLREAAERAARPAS